MGATLNSTSIVVVSFVCMSCTHALAQYAPGAEEAATGSLLSRAQMNQPMRVDEDGDEVGALRQVSLFAIETPKPREFAKHDLVQIVVRETSRVKSTQELETEKSYDLNGEISAWPDFRLDDLANLQIFAGRMTDLPELGLTFDKDFEGEGEYQRRDDLTARISAEVIEILPNGNLVLEARTRIQTDEEVSNMKVTGICRPEDVSPANTILSHQLHDLKIEKINEGELKRTGEKGIIAKVLDAIFAF